MRLFKFKSDKIVLVPLKKYLIDWEGRSPSKIQGEVKKFLHPYWKGCIVCEEFRIPGSLLRIDFVNFNYKIAIEVSPKSHHGKFNKFFHKTRAGYLKAIISDFEKREWLEKNQFRLVDVFDEDMPLTRKFFKEKYDIEI